jgi:hypothetical protein
LFGFVLGFLDSHVVFFDLAFDSYGFVDIDLLVGDLFLKHGYFLEESVSDLFEFFQLVVCNLDLIEDGVVLLVELNDVLTLSL